MHHNWNSNRWNWGLVSAEWMNIFRYVYEAKLCKSARDQGPWQQKLRYWSSTSNCLNSGVVYSIFRATRSQLGGWSQTADKTVISNIPKTLMLLRCACPQYWYCFHCDTCSSIIVKTLFGSRGGQHKFSTHTPKSLLRHGIFSSKFTPLIYAVWDVSTFSLLYYLAYTTDLK